MYKMTFLKAMQAIQNGKEVYYALYSSILYKKGETGKVVYKDTNDENDVWCELLDGFKSEHLNDNWHIYEEPKIVHWLPRKYDSVLVRNSTSKKKIWVLEHFHSFTKDSFLVTILNRQYDDYIPFRDETESLIGTSKEPKIVYVAGSRTKMLLNT